jgi:predicted DNA-binding transcriptional regulator AlpA
MSDSILGHLHGLKALAAAAQSATSDSVCIDVEDLSTLLKKSRATLHRYRAQGKLPKPLGLGKGLRWRLSEIQAWIEAGCPDQVTWERTKRLRS